jgi:glycosyltransferase involved in cell wall biosynthesis
MGIDTVVLPLGRRSAASTRERVRLDSIVDLPPYVRELSRLLSRIKADVVHTNTVKAHVTGGAAARLAGLPCVAHIRDILDGFGRQIVRTAIGTFTKERIAISNVVDRSYALAHTTVVDNPLDLSLYDRRVERSEARRRLGISDDGVPLAGMVGRINRWKGQDRFLRAIAVARRTVPVRAAIVGAPLFRDADFVPELLAMIRSLDLENVVSVLPWQPDPRTVYEALDIHVNASTREPFGRTVIEAAAMSVPTVCFDDSGVADNMLENGIGVVVPAGNECLLAAGIASLAADAEARQGAGHEARVWAARFDATLHAARVTEILRRATVK